MAEQINIPFQVETPEDSRNIVLDEGPQSPSATEKGRAFDAASAKLLWILV